MSSGKGTEGEEANLPATRHSNRAEIRGDSDDNGRHGTERKRYGACRICMESLG